MARAVYVASVEGHTMKSVVALGVLEQLNQNYGRVAVFRPVTPDARARDNVLELLFSQATARVDFTDCIGVSYAELHAGPERALEKIVSRYRALEADCDAVLIIGSDYTDVVSPTELSFNSRVATNIGAPMLLVLNGRAIYQSAEHLGQAEPRTPAEIAQVAAVALEEISLEHTTLLAAVVNRADPDRLSEIEAAVSSALASVRTGAGQTERLPVWAITEDPYLVAPRMNQLREAVSGELVFGDPARLEDEALDIVVGAMTEVNVLNRLKDHAVVLVPSDRVDVILPLIMADSSDTFPRLAGLVLNGGFELPENIVRLIEGLNPSVPVITTDGGTFDTAMQMIARRGVMVATDVEKLARARTLFRSQIDQKALARAIEQTQSLAVTPLSFEFSLFERARAVSKTVVLPEGGDDRILQAAAEVLERGLARLIILGDPGELTLRAEALGVSLAGADIFEISDSPHFERAAVEYARLREHRGMTLERAREVLLDANYFSTMLVHLGVADGMVSGAINTTADTIRPAFEIIRTQPGVSSVSSVFLMALADRVLVYGDCAIIAEPTVEQLADIAISSAATAAAFDIDPHVAMLSYSTGSSGFGAEVDRVRAATELARSRAPELLIEGPIQYDAAVDVAVATAKLPGSQVAGRATVFVFPDLNTGNNTYKAVQRTAGAIAIGPVLQGLNKPVNDLSRGALVRDIVNTIAITAIQAQQVGEQLAPRTQAIKIAGTD
jgi:phosphate acetyltransferase